MTTTWAGMLHSRYQWAAIFAGITGLLLALYGLTAGFSKGQPAEKLSPLIWQTYIWQRVWNPEISVSMAESEDFMEEYCILSAELRFLNGGLASRRLNPDWSALKKSRRSIGAAVRVFTSVAQTGWSDDAVKYVGDIAEDIARDFAAHTVPLSELQLDYDCPESKLSDYTRLVRTLRQRMPGMRIVITALPSWLKHAGFEDLASAASGFVLQVHSLHLPKTNREQYGLCDVMEAKRAVKLAGKLRVPFRVALPTYSCIVQFDEEGCVREVYAEDVPADFPNSPNPYVVLDSDAFAMSALLKEWQQQRPPAMSGVIWYRLPVAADRLNWALPVLRKVCNQEPLRRGWAGDASLKPEGHQEIVLRNNADAPDDLPRKVRVEWSGGSVGAYDGLGDYVLGSSGKNWVEFRLRDPHTKPRAVPAHVRVIGWCRADGPGTTLHVFPEPL